MYIFSYFVNSKVMIEGKAKLNRLIMPILFQTISQRIRIWQSQIQRFHKKLIRM